MALADSHFQKDRYRRMSRSRVEDSFQGPEVTMSSRLAAAEGYCWSSHAASFLTHAMPSFVPSFQAVRSTILTCACSSSWVDNRARCAACGAASLHRLIGAEDAVDRSPQRLGAVDDEKHLALGIDAPRHELFHQRGHRRGVLRGPFADAQHMLAPLRVHAHHANHRAVAEDESVGLDDHSFRSSKRRTSSTSTSASEQAIWHCSTRSTMAAKITRS